MTSPHSATTERQLTRAEVRGPGSVALGLVLVTVFVDLVGFGIILPLLPFYATSMGASPLDVGLIMASYSLMQLLFSPVWGSLSDRYGRRPILIFGLFGSAISFHMLARAHGKLTYCPHGIDSRSLP